MDLFLSAFSLLLHATQVAVGPTTCTITDSRIAESSGIAVSGDVVWTHNDSGDSARFFALDRQCRTLATYTVSGATARDWEDMARGGGALWFGDIGDNSGTRDTVLVQKVREPDVTPGTHAVSATAYRFRYPDGRHDAEALLVHPRTGQLLIVTKNLLGSATVFAAPVQPSVTEVNDLTEVATVPARWVTGGDINATATRVVLRSYTDAYEWRVPNGDLAAAFATTPTTTELPAAQQGEAIAYDTDGRSWVTTSEGAGAPVTEIPR